MNKHYLQSGLRSPIAVPANKFRHTPVVNSHAWFHMNGVELQTFRLTESLYMAGISRVGECNHTELNHLTESVEVDPVVS